MDDGIDSPAPLVAPEGGQGLPGGGCSDGG